MKTRSLFQILLAITVFCLKGYSQNREIDSLREVLENPKSEEQKIIALSYLAFYYINIDKDSAYIITNKAIKAAIATNNQEGLASAYNTLGWYYYQNGESLKSIPLIKKSISIYIKINEVNELSKSYCNLSSIYIRLNKFGEAFECLTKALKIVEKTKDRKTTSHVYKNLGIVYRLMKESDKAEEYFLKALDFSTDEKEKNDIKMSLANLYLISGRHGQAMKNYNEILEYSLTNQNYNLTALTYENIANLYLSKKAYPVAEKFFDKALRYYRKLGNEADVVYMQMQLAEIYHINGDTKKAIRSFEEAHELSEKLKLIHYQSNILKQLAGIYEQTGDYAAALEKYKKSVELEYSQRLDEQQAKLDELQTRFETEKKEKEIKILNKDKVLQEQKMKLQRTLLTISGLVILIILLFIAFITNRNKLKQRNKELELRNRIASDLHDDVGSSLSSIRLLSEMVRENKSSSPEMLEKISGNIKETIESMSDIVWMIKPDTKNFTVSGLENRMAKFLSDICASSHKEYSFQAKNTENIELGMLHKRNIYLIFKEAVNNAIKIQEPAVSKFRLSAKTSSWF